jgi:hypothetical protein
MGTWPLEGPGASLAVYREVSEFAERWGVDSLWSASASLVLLVSLGSWDNVLDAAEGLAERSDAAGLVLNLVTVRSTQAHVLALRGRADEALPLADWAVGAARESSATDFIAAAFPIGALARCIGQQLGGARALLAELVEIPHVHEAPNYADALPEMIRTAVACEDLTLAKRLASRLEPVYPLNEHALCAARAILAEAKGDTDQASILYADAADRWEGFGMVPERAFALLGQGRCLLALERQPKAMIMSLRTAREIFDDLGATPAVVETDLLLQRAMTLT